MVALARSFLVLFHVSLCLNEVVLGGWPQLGGFGYPYPTNLLIHDGFSDESIYDVNELGLCDRLSRRCRKVQALAEPFDQAS